MFCGSGRIVEIDKTALGHKCKYNRGTFRGSGLKWVFGILDTSTKKCHVQWVPDQTRPTLFAIINDHILPNTIIHLDEARVYHTLGAQPYKHSVSQRKLCESKRRYPYQLS